MEKLPLPQHTGGDHDGQTAGVGCSEEAEEERMEERPEELKILIQILSDVLEQTDIGIKTNYYAAGGDSIKAIIVSSRLRELGYGLEVRDILLNPGCGGHVPPDEARDSGGKQWTCERQHRGDAGRQPVLWQQFTESRLVRTIRASERRGACGDSGLGTRV